MRTTFSATDNSSVSVIFIKLLWLKNTTPTDSMNKKNIKHLKAIKHSKIQNSYDSIHNIQGCQQPFNSVLNVQLITMLTIVIKSLGSDWRANTILSALQVPLKSLYFSIISQTQNERIIKKEIM